MKDELGKRMKENYENRTRIYLPRRTYTIIRLDGKAFGTFTKGLDVPFDRDFTWLMNTTAQFLCSEVQGAKLAYVQSDEISLLLTDFAEDGTQAWFDGNIQKITSVSASLATWFFNERMNAMIDNHSKTKFLGAKGGPKLALFDSRTFTISDPVEVENYFVWRQKDAIRNSISMLAQSLYSQKELNKKSQADMLGMIILRGKDWGALDGGYKRGRLVTSKEVTGLMNDDYEDAYSFYRDSWPIMAPGFIHQRESFRSIIPMIH